MDLKVVFDEEIKELVDKIFSSMLPHSEDKYNGKAVKVILRNLKKILPQNETYGEYWVLYDKFLNQEKISLIEDDYVPKLSRDILESSTGVRIDDYIQNKELEIERFLEENGFDTDISIRANYEKACGLLFDMVLAKFDSLMDLAVEPNDGFSYLDSLKHVVETNLYRQSVTVGAQILNNGVWLDKHMYKGNEGYREFSSKFPSWIKARFSGFLSNKVEEFSFLSIEDNKRFRKDFKHDIYELFKFGYQPLDDVIGVNTSDVVTLIGDEGVGKTNFTVDLAVKCMLNGGDVLFMTGESSLNKIKYMCLARLMYEIYGKSLSWKEVQNIEDLPENVQLEIEDVDIKMVTSPDLGRLHLVRKFEYETFYNKVKEKCEEHKNIRLVVVDHIGRLSTTGEFTSKGYLKTDKERVDYLYEQAIDIGDDYPLAVLLLAHSNTVANQDTNKDKAVGTRIGALSSATSKDSDLVLYLRKNEMLNKQDMVKLETKKVREGSSNIRPFILKRNGICSVFEYHEENQIIKEDDFSEDELFMD